MKDRVVFACDIGGSKLLCGLVTEEGNVLDTERISLASTVTTEELEEKIEKLYEALCGRNPKQTAIACGMTIPGLADAENGIWQYACFSGISDYRIAERMEQRLYLPIIIENDVNACALAEKRYGACRDCDDYLWVTVSNGVGGGLVLNGQLYRGAFGGAGEFGHIVIDENGYECHCGHKGCMEAMAAGPAISRRYEQITGKCLAASEIAALAEGGEADAVSVMRKTGTYIGKGLGKVACLLNPERYVLGGGVMQSFELMREDIQAAFEQEAFAFPNRGARILPTALNYEAGLLGAAAIAWESIVS